jgi:hypothetical protein
MAVKKKKQPSDKTIRIDDRIIAILKEYCKEHGVEPGKFIEEAVLEKLEIDGIKEEMYLYDDFEEIQDDAPAPVENIRVYSEMDPDPGKKKH